MPSNRPLYPGDSLATTEKLGALVNLHALKLWVLSLARPELPAGPVVVLLWLKVDAGSAWPCMGTEGTEVAPSEAQLSKLRGCAGTQQFCCR